MISICIPVYNHNISNLLTSLQEQCKDLDSDYEIILIDDASEHNYQETNKNTVKELNDDKIRYEELNQNIGRAAIRNLLALKAAFPYLIFMDNDAEICSSDFILKYIRQRSPGIICYGGCVYSNEYNEDENLRWIYGVNREAIPADIRMKSPENHFSTFNFMIDKRVLLLHPFNENIREYGYEDVFFRIDLLKQGYSIKQIDNPLIHNGLIPNKEFIGRTRTALCNLYLLQKETDTSYNLAEYIHILKSLNKLEKLKLLKPVAYFYKLSEKSFIKNLTGKNPSLFIFDLYKLGYLCNLKTQKKNVNCQR